LSYKNKKSNFLLGRETRKKGSPHQGREDDPAVGTRPRELERKIARRRRRKR
jgi:hypothetical protein